MLVEFKNLFLNFINFRRPALLFTPLSDVIFFMIDSSSQSESQKSPVTAPADMAAQTEPMTLLGVCCRLQAGRQPHLTTAQEVFSAAVQKSKFITQRRLGC